MKRILIADDEYDIASMLELILSDEGYRVSAYSNGRDLLNASGDEAPDLIILDNMMPILTGLETLLELKKDPELKIVPVILISAAVPKVSQREYKWDVFIKKPFDVSDIVLRVNELIGSATS